MALLVRQAVEMWLAQYWDATAPGVAAASRKAQLLLLNDRLPEDAAAEAHATWSQLSHACHHRVFDLEPIHRPGAAVDCAGRARRGRAA